MSDDSQHQRREAGRLTPSHPISLTSVASHSLTQALDVVAQLVPAADEHSDAWLHDAHVAARVLRSLCVRPLPPAGSHVRLTVPTAVEDTGTAWFAVPADGARHCGHNTDVRLAPLLHAIAPEVHTHTHTPGRCYCRADQSAVSDGVERT